MSSMAANTGKAGSIVAPHGSSVREQLLHATLDDLLYNITHDLVLKTHREEKMARAATAAIRVEKLASDSSDSPTPDSRPDVRVETDAAIYEDGKVMLKGNPFKTTKDVLCPRCHLPRLLAPTDGKGSQKPDPGIIYCKKHPYIDKPGYDIYGQTWVAPGPGRGKKKKDMDAKGDVGSANNDGPRPAHVLAFPSATCSKCKRCILVTRLNNHMGSCIGNSGRNASRVASQKISNGGNDPTPPSSQKGTPLPGSRAGSPRKRDSAEFDEDDDSGSDATTNNNKNNSQVKRKKMKHTTSSSLPSKKLNAKSKKLDKTKSTSFLRAESKFDDDDDDVRSVSVVPPPPPTKKSLGKITSPAKKLKLGLAKAPLSSPASTKHGTDAGDDSDVSETYSTPPR